MTTPTRPPLFRTFSNPSSLPPRSSISTTTSTTTSTTPSEHLIFPNPAISVLSSVSRHAKRTCKQLARFRRHGDAEKAPDMAKMRIVTPVYDHVLGRWVWPGHVYVEDDEEEDQIRDGRRRTCRSGSRSISSGCSTRDSSRSRSSR